MAWSARKVNGSRKRPVSASLNGVAASLPHLMKLHIDNSKLTKLMGECYAFPENGVLARRRSAARHKPLERTFLGHAATATAALLIQVDTGRLS
jgi:hypothetical protein